MLVDVLGDRSFMIESCRVILLWWMNEGIENVSSQSGALIKSLTSFALVLV